MTSLRYLKAITAVIALTVPLLAQLPTRVALAGEAVVSPIVLAAGAQGVANGAAQAPESGAPEAASQTEDPTATVHRLVDDVRARISEGLALDGQIKNATGEQRAVFIEQQSVKRRVAGAAFRELVAEIVRLREHGIDDGGASKAAAAFLDRVNVWNEEHIERTSAELERLRTERESADDDDLFKIEEQLARANAEYDQLLSGKLFLAVARENIGRDASAEYARLDKLLAERTELRANQVRLTRNRIVDYTKKIAGAATAEAERLRVEIARLQDLLDRRTASLQKLVELMDSRGLPSAEYRQLLITATGEITADIFKREVAVGLAQHWWQNAKEWLAARGSDLAFKFVLTAAILFAFHLSGRLTQRLVRRAFQSSRISLSQLLRDFILSTVYRVVVVLGILIALAQLGVQIGPLLTGLGVAGFIVGFALQDTLANFASGMMILAYRPFDVGDIVKAGGVDGKVAQMTLVTTTILTFDNQRLIVPNTKIWGDVIMNVTAERIRRVDLMFGIGYTDDVDHAERILCDIVEQHVKVLKSPVPNIKLHELGESSVNFIVRPWAKTVDYWDVYWDVTREVKRRFDAEGISIPFPQRDVHLYAATSQTVRKTDAE